MPCSSILAPALMAMFSCGQPAAVARQGLVVPAVHGSAMRGAQTLSDPKLAQIRGGRGFGSRDRLTTEVLVREMTALRATAGQTMDNWWSAEGATLIAANLVR